MLSTAFTLLLVAVMLGLHSTTALAQTDDNAEIPPVGQEDDDAPYGFAGDEGDDDRAEVLGRQVSPSQDLSDLLVPNQTADPVSPNSNTALQRFAAAWFRLPFWLQQLIGIPIFSSVIFGVMFGGARLFGRLRGRHVRRA